MSSLSIKFDGVGKLYQLGAVGTGTLSHDLNRWWQTKILGREDPFLKIGQRNDRSGSDRSGWVWALRDATFEVHQGDVVGVIGSNGAGKSTLLKLLSKVTSPTTGVIKARGRISSLLEVGTGFHPEMTGRENIFMNGAILGMSRQEIRSKLDDIIDFAGVSMYIDTPVKRYSTGMLVRLGFAVAAFLEPEILVIDEVLAVGDAEFQSKALGKVKDVASRSGRTVLFVSHNMAAVRNLCTSAIVLNQGTVGYIGNVAEGIKSYLSAAVKNDGGERIVERITFLRGGIKVNKIFINGTEHTQSTLLSAQDTLEVTVEGHTDAPLTTDLMLRILTCDQVPLATLAEGQYRGRILKFSSGDFVIKRSIKLPRFVSKGTYLIDINLHHPMVEWQMKAPVCATLDVQGTLEGAGSVLNAQYDGLFGLETC